MLFNTPEYFFGFLPVVVAVYFLLQKMQWSSVAKIWLVGTSLYFYAYWNPVYIFLIASSICVNYAVASGLPTVVLAALGQRFPEAHSSRPHVPHPPVDRRAGSRQRRKGVGGRRSKRLSERGEAILRAILVISE